MPNLLPILAQPFLPPWQTLRRYDLGKLRRDLVAGLTVSVVEVPQAMAYALIAGVPPQYGLYTSIIQGVIGALLSSSEHLTTGPTNTQSLLIASAATRVAGLAGALPPEAQAALYLELVFGLALLKGLIQLAFAAAQMGNMVRYVSRSVIVGVAAGAGVLIVVGQLPAFLGITVPATTPHHLPGALGALERLWPHLGEVNPRAAGLALGALAVVLGARLIWRFLPGSLLAVALAGVVVAAAGWEAAVPTIQPLAPTLPHFHVPQITLAQSEALFGGALALALLGMLESVAIVKAIATHTGERINPNQEFFAQGLKNLLSSFLQCIPGSGSFTRSALDYAAGAATRFAAVFNALFVAVIYFLCGGLARYVPLASLAAVLFVIAYGLIDWGYLARTVRSSRADATVCLATFAATLLAPLEYAVFIGVFLNLALYLRRAGRLHLHEMVPPAGWTGPFVERPVLDRAGQRRMVFLQVEGDLFFAVADELQDQLAAVASSGVRVVILRLKRTHSIDATVLHVLDQFARTLQAQGGHLLLCGVKPELMRVLGAFGLTARLGPENVFPTEYGVFTSARRALERGQQLVGTAIDPTGLEFTQESEAWAYEI